MRNVLNDIGFYALKWLKWEITLCVFYHTKKNHTEQQIYSVYKNLHRTIYTNVMKSGYLREGGRGLEVVKGF